MGRLERREGEGEGGEIERRGRDGWGGWKGKGKGKGKRERLEKWGGGIYYLGLGCFLLYIFFNLIKPVRFGPVQSV